MARIMPERLTERFPIGAFVEIDMADLGWLPGQVVEHAPPAVWVRTEDGRFWFVTNGRKIRKLQQNEDNDVHNVD
jgi:hypothetical protein